jgi:hypothetical protein
VRSRADGTASEVRTLYLAATSVARTKALCASMMVMSSSTWIRVSAPPPWWVSSMDHRSSVLAKVEHFARRASRSSLSTQRIERGANGAIDCVIGWFPRCKTVRSASHCWTTALMTSLKAFSSIRSLTSNSV